MPAESTEQWRDLCGPCARKRLRRKGNLGHSLGGSDSPAPACPECGKRPVEMTVRLPAEPEG